MGSNNCPRESSGVAPAFHGWPNRRYVRLDGVQPASSGGWWVGGASWTRRPLFTAWILGCAVSLLEVGSLTPSRVLGSALTWAWAPLLQIASLAAVWKMAPRSLPFRPAVDLFFAGNLCWWLWLVVFSLCHSLAAAPAWLLSAIAVSIYSAWVDYRFFRKTLASGAPVRDLILQRATAWIPGILIFGGGSLVPGLVEKLR